MAETCTYCGSDVFDHDPVFVDEGKQRMPAGQFCNWACLDAYIDEDELTVGSSCEVDLS